MGFEAEEGWLKKLYIKGSAIEVVESENRIGSKRKREEIRWRRRGTSQVYMGFKVFVCIHLQRLAGM